MKVAIVEKGHFEVAYTLITLFDKEGNDITVFIDEASHEQLTYLLKDKMNRYQWIVQTTESNRDFIKTIFKHINQAGFDLIYFDTIADNFIHYAGYIRKLGHPSVIMALHDMNGYFNYTASWSIRKAVRFIGKKMLLKIVPSFNVLSETLIPLLRQKLPPAKKIFNIPGGFFDPEQFTSRTYGKNEPISITVPGSIDDRRRDYTMVLNLLEAAKKQTLDISVTLLGSFRKGHSEAIHARIIDYLKTSDNLIVYETAVVSQPEFDRVMRQAHFIWMPLQISTIVTDGAREQYGTSISTGNIGDTIRHALPFFAPSFFNVDHALQPACCRYTGIADILDTLKNMDSEVYRHLQENALQASLQYTLDKIIARNKSMFS